MPSLIFACLSASCLAAVAAAPPSPLPPPPKHILNLLSGANRRRSAFLAINSAYIIIPHPLVERIRLGVVCRYRPVVPDGVSTLRPYLRFFFKFIGRARSPVLRSHVQADIA